MRVKQALSKKQLQKALKALPEEWKPNAATSWVKASFTQPDYISGLVFIARIAVHAELAQHHPDITYTYDTVSVKLTTHSVKGLTEKDFALAKKISSLATAKQ